jgi:hypothetical protein
VQACNPSTQEAEAGGLFKANQGDPISIIIIIIITAIINYYCN